MPSAPWMSSTGEQDVYSVGASPIDYTPLWGHENLRQLWLNTGPETWVLGITPATHGRPASHFIGYNSQTDGMSFEELLRRWATMFFVAHMPKDGLDELLETVQNTYRFYATARVPALPEPTVTFRQGRLGPVFQSPGPTFDPE